MQAFESFDFRSTNFSVSFAFFEIAAHSGTSERPFETLNFQTFAILSIWAGRSKCLWFPNEAFNLKILSHNLSFKLII